MRKTRKLLFIAILAILIVATFVLGACDLSFGNGAKLSVKLDENQVIYENDDFEKVKSYLTVTYKDSLGNEQEITDFTLSGTLSAGNCVITVSYNGVSAKITVKVAQLEEATGLEYELSEDETYYIVTGIGTETRTAFSIPATYNNLPVKEIGYQAFSYCESLASVAIPDCIIGIQQQAFERCHGLTNVIFGKNSKLESIGRSAFYRCERLNNIVIPESVMLIDDEAFGWCGSFTTIKIPDSVTTIGDSAFTYCYGVTSVTVGRNLAEIGSWAFGCPKLVEVYNLSSLEIVAQNEDDDTGLGYLALSVHTSLDEASNLSTDSDGYVVYTRNDDKILVGYVGDSTDLVIPSYVTEIYQYALVEKSNITSVVIPDSVRVIGDCSFGNCFALETVTIGNGVTSIGEQAFQDCDSLATVTIPASVTSMGSQAFASCNSLASVTFGENSQIESIGSSVFNGCTSLQSIDIPNSVTSIGPGVFGSCSGLISVTFGENSRLASIGSAAFYACHGLISLDIPSSVTSIGEYAFYGCNNLVYNEYDNAYYLGNDSNPYLALVGAKSTGITTCSIHKDTVVVADAFNGCSSLTSIVIPDNVTSIGDYAFNGCSSLTSIVIPDNVTSIGDYAFNGCSSLTSIVIPSNVASIGRRAFDGCSSLIIYCEAESQPDDWDSGWNSSRRSVVWNCNNNDVADNGKIYMVIDGLRYTLKDGVATVIGGGKNITSASILSSVIYKEKSYPVASIGAGAFYGCTSLTSIFIPSSVTSIGEYAFYGCTSLTSIVIPSNVASIGSWAFDGCSSLTIYCEVNSQPSSWRDWNVSDCPVVWGYVAY